MPVPACRLALLSWFLPILAVASMSACGGNGDRPAAEGVARGPDPGELNLFVWSDFMAPTAVADFEKSTGVRVRVSYFDNNDTMEARLMAGHSGFDVVMTSATAFKRQIDGGAYRPLDVRLIPNLSQLDPELLQKTAAIDPGGRHGAIYAWGTLGILYNRKLVGHALPGKVIDSWGALFDPNIAAHLSRCGISFIDDAPAVVKLVLKYLGRNPDSPSDADFADVESTLLAIRPFVRTIDTGTILDTMTNGDGCIALDYNSDAFLDRRRAAEAGNGVDIGFVIPKEGSLIWMNWLAIPADAPHVANAHRFIDHLLDARTSANFTNLMGSANGNPQSLPLLDASIRADNLVYPTAEERARLFVEAGNSPQRARTVTRIWQRFKTGQR